MTWRFRIAASFSSNIKDGGNDGNLETLQTTSDFELLKAMGSDSQDGHHGTVYHIMISQFQVSDFWPIWVSSFKETLYWIHSRYLSTMTPMSYHTLC